MTDETNPRLKVLVAHLERRQLALLADHGWDARIARSASHSDYVVIEAERGGLRRTAAVLYSTGVAREIYTRLDGEVDALFHYGEAYRLQEFAGNVADRVSPLHDFQRVLIDWNRAASKGKLAVDADEAAFSEADDRTPIRDLQSETPIDAIWLRLRQFQSTKLAQRMITSRDARAGVLPGGVLASERANGVAFALRNAADYFESSRTRTISQRVLSLYYGTMAFAFAEMLASPNGPDTLVEIEERTKQGHGLYVIDGSEPDDLGTMVVGTIRSGFFGYWMEQAGVALEGIPAAKAKTWTHAQALGGESWLTLEGLFARIPEIADLFVEIFPGPSWWLEPNHHDSANAGMNESFVRPVVTRTYAALTDSSSRLSLEDVATFPGPISEVARMPAGRHGRRFRAAIDHDADQIWWDALPLHTSALAPTALIKPIFGNVGIYRAICFVLLYALSIIVRYRPSVWRRVQEGDLDHLRVLIEAFLVVVERVLPEHFLASITGDRIVAKQPGSWF